MKLKNKFMYILTILIAIIFMCNIEAQTTISVTGKIDLCNGLNYSYSQSDSSACQYVPSNSLNFSSFMIWNLKGTPTGSNEVPMVCLDPGKEAYVNETYTCEVDSTYDGLACYIYNNLGSSETDKYIRVQKDVWNQVHGSAGLPGDSCATTTRSNEETITNQRIDIGTPVITYDEENNYVIKVLVTPTSELGNYNLSLIGAPTGTTLSSNKTSGRKNITIKVPAKNVTKDNISFSLNIVSDEYVSKSYTETTEKKVANVCTPNRGYNANTDQRLIYVSINTSSSNKEEKSKVTASATISIPTGSIEIYKYNEKNNKAVSGVIFELYDSTGENKITTDALGNELPQLKTDENGKILISNLLFGTYVLKEVSTAEGYLIDKPVSLTISISDTSTVKKNISNKPIMTKISKKVISGETELEGAHIIIFDEENNIVDEFDSNLEIHEIYLGPGKYKLKETISPEGYQVLDTIFNFEIKNNGDAVLLDVESEYFKTNKNEITIYNKPVEVEVPDTGKVSIIFSIIGFILVIAGAVVIYMKRIRINNNI